MKIDLFLFNRSTFKAFIKVKKKVRYRNLNDRELSKVANFKARKLSLASKTEDYEI
tara:strand:- start:139829 stop:139996 length:168 start_codon:yes stop_codon:yes gene_type:complete